jgi:hypothetical protein
MCQAVLQVKVIMACWEAQAVVVVQPMVDKRVVFHLARIIVLVGQEVLAVRLVPLAQVAVAVLLEHRQLEAQAAQAAAEVPLGHLA